MHRLHPVVKLLTAMIYIIVVVSYGRYDIIGLLPLVFYPMIVIAAADIPVKPILKRLLIVMPFIVLIGIFNPVFDTQPVQIGSAVLARGWITFLSLFIKGILTVTAAFLLIATTGMDRMAVALRLLKIPKILVLQLLLTYRYITVLMEEVNNTMVAYSLRAPGQKGVQYKVWGSLTGQLLLRTYDRGQRLYNAMLLRGFEGEYNTGENPSLHGLDMLFLLGWTILFILCRLYNIPVLVGTIVTGIVG